MPGKLWGREEKSPRTKPARLGQLHGTENLKADFVPFFTNMKRNALGGVEGSYQYY